MGDELEEISVSSEDSGRVQAFCDLWVKEGGRVAYGDEGGRESDSEDEEGGSEGEGQGGSGKRRKKDESKSESKHAVNWGPLNKGGARTRQSFCGRPGLTQEPMVLRSGINNSPCSYFRLTLTEEMRKLIMVETNKQAERKRVAGAADPEQKELKWAQNWKPIDLAELDVWLGVLILKGISHKGNEKSFWSTSWLLSRGAASNVMSRNRFMDIKRALHCQTDEDEPESDEHVRKIGKLFDMFNKNNCKIYELDENCAIDEAILPFSGNSAFKHNMEKKPHSHGLKVFAVGESSTGFVARAVLDRRNQKTVHEFVMELLGAVKGVWRTIYMDNLFTSVYTLREMLKEKTYGAGTARAGRGLPPDLEKTKVELENKGDFKFKQGPDLLLGVAWQDSGHVVGLSTRHDGSDGVVLRREKGKAGRHERKCPDIFVDYNKYMGGVDLADQRRARHTCRLRAYKWWHPVFYWIIDTAMVNAHIIRNAHIQKKMKASDFWLSVVEELFEEALGVEVDERPEELAKFTRAGKAGVSWNLGDKRLLGRHYLTKCDKHDKCKLCMHTFQKGSTAYNRKTNNYCPKCEVTLHMECFEAFHEQAEPKSTYDE